MAIAKRVGFEVVGCYKGVQFDKKYLSNNPACEMMIMYISRYHR